MDNFKSSAVILLALTALIVVVKVFSARFKDLVFNSRLLKNKSKLFYRVLSRQEQRHKAAWYLKAWVNFDHDHLIEFMDLKIMMNPFPEGMILKNNPEFAALLKSFPGLQLNEILIKHGRIEVLAKFYSGEDAEALRANFPPAIEEWFETICRLIVAVPGKNRQLFLIRLDKYTDLMIRYFFVLLIVSFMTRPLFEQPALTYFMGNHYNKIVYVYLMVMIVVFVSYFKSKKSLPLRAFSKLFMILFTFIVLNLLVYSLKS